MNTITTSIPVDLTGQVVIVTGGGRGIGRAIAQALAKAGAKVAVAARSTSQLDETVSLIEKAGGFAHAFTVDVTDQQAVEAMVATVEHNIGPISLLINNAGYGGPAGPSWETNPDDWWRCLDVNLRGVYLCSHAVLPSMVKRRQGRILNIASNAGLWAGDHISAYAISKCAVIRLSENQAAELAPHGVSVFAVHPGLVHTTMVQDKIDERADAQWLGNWFANALADGMDIPPQHAADLVLLLASGRADALSGCYLDVNMDIEEMLRSKDSIRENGLYKLRLHTL